MPDHDDRRIVEYERLNLFGKAVFVGGSVVRGLANLIDFGLERAATLVVDAEKAFQEGRDPNIEDAKILDETDENQREAP